MTDVNIRSDSVDVEQIMRQIRTRIREKRGVDYTEAEVQQLAKVKLEKFLDSKGVRSDLLEQYQRQRSDAPALTNFEFGEDTLYETHRAPLRAVRRLLRPVLKLFFNPDKLTSVLHLQSQLNTQLQQGPLMFELIHNLTVEMTRLAIEVQSLKMRVESLSSRMDFDERRARSLESVVQYRPPARPAGGPPQPAAAPAQSTPSAPASARQDQAPAPGLDGAGGERRRRRRRRRRRPGQTMADGQQGGWAARGGDGQRGSEGGGPGSPDTGADIMETSDGPDEPDGHDGPDSTDQ